MDERVKRYFPLALVVALLAVGMLAVYRYFRSYDRTTSTILTSVECAPPCWFGITPGISTPDEIFTFLARYDWIDQNSVAVTRGKDRVNQIRWAFRRPVGDLAAYVYFDQERASSITIFTGGSLRLIDAIEKMGEPEKVWTHANGELGSVLLLYPSRGCLVMLEMEKAAGQNVVEIGDSTKVSRVTYFDPQRFDDFLESPQLGDRTVKIRAEDMRPWNGLGAVEFK